MPKIILRQTQEVLHTYPYDKLNTGQTVKSADGDDKDIRDTVFAPEIAAQIASGLTLSFTVLDQTDPTKLLRGSNPDGSGTNIFGNLDRFTDTVGTQVYANGLVIDHYTGLMLPKDFNLNLGVWTSTLDFHNSLNLGGYSDWHCGNLKQYESIIDVSLENQLNYPPFNFILVDGATKRIWTSTSSNNSSLAYQVFLNSNNSYGCLPRNKADFETFAASFRKAFTYNPTTKQMELI